MWLDRYITADWGQKLQETESQCDATGAIITYAKKCKILRLDESRLLNRGGSCREQAEQVADMPRPMSAQ